MQSIPPARNSFGYVAQVDVSPADASRTFPLMSPAHGPGFQRPSSAMAYHRPAQRESLARTAASQGNRPQVGPRGGHTCAVAGIPCPHAASQRQQPVSRCGSLPLHPGSHATRTDRPGRYWRRRRGAAAAPCCRRAGRGAGAFSANAAPAHEPSSPPTKPAMAAPPGRVHGRPGTSKRAHSLRASRCARFMALSRIGHDRRCDDQGRGTPPECACSARRARERLRVMAGQAEGRTVSLGFRRGPAASRSPER